MRWITDSQQRCGNVPVTKLPGGAWRRNPRSGSGPRGREVRGEKTVEGSPNGSAPEEPPRVAGGPARAGGEQNHHATAADRQGEARHRSSPPAVARSSNRESRTSRAVPQDLGSPVLDTAHCGALGAGPSSLQEGTCPKQRPCPHLWKRAFQELFSPHSAGGGAATGPPAAQCAGGPRRDRRAEVRFFR